MGFRGIKKNPSLGITVWHHSASLVMSDSDPLDGCFCLHLRQLIDPYTKTDVWCRVKYMFSISLVMLKSYPWSGCFSVCTPSSHTNTLMKDSYLLKWTVKTLIRLYRSLASGAEQRYRWAGAKPQINHLLNDDYMTTALNWVSV